MLLLVATVFCCCTLQAQDPLYKQKSDFTDLRFGVMLHFNMGTFTDEEWAKPNQDPKTFNPAGLDCNQWADACKAAGMKYAILTTKHHDGFCLWDSKYTDYDVAGSSVKKDVVAEYVKAFRSRGLKPCLYFSIWDRHNGVENGGPKEEEFILNQLTELLINYGEIPMIIFDGWNWKTGHRLISYKRIYEHLKKLQPNCLVSEHNSNSNFQTDIIYYEGPKGVFPPGNNVFSSQMALTLTDGWFWHPETPKTVKSIAFTLDKLQRLEPIYCNFMLNISPNREGLFDKEVVAHLAEIGKKWRPNPKRLPLPEQPLNMISFTDPVAVHASPGLAVAVPAPPATEGSPIARLLEEQTPDVMIDGISDEVPKNGGFSPFQTCWKFTAAQNRYVMLDLGSPMLISKFYYQPARLMGYSGIITGYTLYAGDDEQSLKEIKKGSWPMNTDLKIVGFTALKARYIKLEIDSSIGDALISETGAGN